MTSTFKFGIAALNFLYIVSSLGDSLNLDISG